MPVPEWAFEILDPNGVPISNLEPKSVKITRRLSKGSGCEFTIEQGAAGFGLVESSAAIIRAWRKPDRTINEPKTVRYFGIMYGVSASGSGDSLESVTVSAPDPFVQLETRIRSDASDYTNGGTGYIPALLVGFVINDAYFDAALEPAPPPGVVYPFSGTRFYLSSGLNSGSLGPARERTYEAGHAYSDEIFGLSEVDDGFYWVIDPLEDGAELNMRYPDPGTVRPDVKFEYGRGTIGNVARATVDVLPPVNRVHVFGSGEGDQQIMVTVADEASENSYGTWTTTATYNDVEDTDVLTQHATDLLRTEPIKTIKVDVATSGDDGIPPVPRLWDDFDVGDDVRVYLNGNTPSLQFDGTATVVEAEVTIDETGVETLSGLTFRGSNA